MPNPRFTPQACRVARIIREQVMGLTVQELLAVRAILEDDWPDNPLAGVREPRNPKPSAGEGAIAKEAE